jgi:hypothetical protein
MQFIRRHAHLILALIAGPAAVILTSPVTKALADGVENWGR